MQVSIKTAQNYLANPSKADPCKMAYLEAYATRKLIPKDWQVWIDSDTLYTDSGYQINRREIESICWLRSTYLNQSNEIQDLKLEIERLNAELEATKRPDKSSLPDSVI